MRWDNPLARLLTTISTIWWLFAILPDVSSYNDCLHLRSSCFRSLECRRLLDEFRTQCGYSTAYCSGASPSDCVQILRDIRRFLRYETCICYEALGSLYECDLFRQLIWNHPCERRLLDYGLEQNIENEIQASSQQYSLRRTTRIPMAAKVEQLKTQLSGELGTREVIQHESCDEALNKVCLRHVSCSQLWKLFRSNCDVDHDNNCRMSDREICWQSFEGLTWTGLGTCQCPTNSSDCHWIRLHTNFNKCIYDITKSGQFPPLSSMLPHQATSQGDKNLMYQEYQQRYEQNMHNFQLSTPRPTPVFIYHPPSTPSMSTSTTTTSTTTPRPPEIKTTTTRKPQVATTRTPEIVSIASREQREPRDRNPQYNENYQRNDDRQNDGTYQNNSQRVIFPSYSRYSTRSPPTHYEAYDERGNRIWPTETTKPTFIFSARVDPIELEKNYDGPKQNSQTALQRTSHSSRSSCQDAIARCEAADECRWQLSELSIRCGGSEANCHKDECASALQRFTRYVPFSLVESIMFCHCAVGDFECIRMQDLLYPKCLYSTVNVLNTCSAVMQQCDSDQRCRHLRHSISIHCAVAQNQCSTKSLDACRRTILSARATLLEQPCFCPLYDVECLVHQKHMIPNNPCIESAMLEYSRLMGYNRLIGSSSFETTNRIGDTTRRQNPNAGNYENSYRNTELELETNHININPTSRTRQRPGERQRETEREKMLEQERQREIEREREREWTREKEKGWRKYTSKTSTTTTLSTVTDSPMSSGFGVNSIDDTSMSLKAATTQRPLSSIHTYQRKQKTTTTTTTTTTKVPMTSEDAMKGEKEVVEKSAQLATQTMTREKVESKKSTKFRTTLEPPLETEAPPPWESTTTTEPPTTTTFVFQTEPPPEGCTTKDTNGRLVFAHVGSVIRKYLDWTSRCSSWCECASENELICDDLTCHPQGSCQAPLIPIEYGERIYLENRGACFCESGKFICDYPEEMPEAYPGLYLSVGYSMLDVELLRKEVPTEILDKAGFVSQDASRDIASRLQIAFERILPKKLQCRIVLNSEMSEAGSAFYRIEWYGKNEALNHTKVQWHHGGAEKECSPYAKRLADMFALSESPRFQLVLSMVRQIKVLDYLDKIPVSTTNWKSSFIAFLLPLFLSFTVIAFY